VIFSEKGNKKAGTDSVQYGIFLLNRYNITDSTDTTPAVSVQPTPEHVPNTLQYSIRSLCGSYVDLPGQCTWYYYSHTKKPRPI